jgi:hypothetical protein
MSWWRRWQHRRKLRKLGMEELVVRVAVSKELFYHGIATTAEVIADEARRVALHAARQKMGLPGVPPGD